jgi:formylglycine-generating enzyme required for sulfatase activity
MVPPLWRVIGPDVTVTDSENQIPKCLRAGPACPEAALSNRTDAAPAVRPLLNKARLGVTLRGLLLREGETDEVDDGRLVDELARCRTPSSVPRRVRRSWPARIQILWDESSALRPLRHDQANVVQWLRRWRGELGLEELIVGERRSPEWHRRIGRGDLARVVVLPRKRPDAGTTLLALSDLGCLNQDVARCEFWASELQQAVKAGAQCRALVPGPPVRWNRSLARRWGARDWERGTRKRTGAARPTLGSNVLEELFVLLSPAAWVDWPLLRAMRRLLDSSGASVATEVDAWLDGRLAARSAPTGFVIEAKVLQRLRADFLDPGRLPEVRRKQVAAFLRTLHAYLGLLPRAEELLSLGDPDSRHQGLELLASYTRLLHDRDGIPEPVESAFAVSVEQRQGPKAWDVEEMRALWALHHAAGDHFDAPLPEGLRAQDIQWALANLPQITVCRLWQRGHEVLWEQAKLVLDVDEKRPGSFLCDLPMRASQVDVRWQESTERSLALDVREGASQSFAPSFGGGEVPRISLSTDLARADIVLTAHPPWADRFWRDGRGLWVETTVRGFEWRLAWREEKPNPAGESLLWRIIVKKRQKPNVVIEPHDLTTRLLWPTWAKWLHVDEHGLFAALELADGVVTRLRWIPPGRFLMASPRDEAGRGDSEGPQHWVNLSKGYWLADAPCTQAEWRAVMGTDPSYFKGEDLPEDERKRLPVEQVSWDDCQRFCERLRARFPGLEARLPSEAEWEHACRAGTASAFNDGSACTEPEGSDPALAKLGWFDKNSEGKTHVVCGLAPNQWGLHDMHGNVWEWCQDWHGAYPADEQRDLTGADSGLGRVFRGGSWDNRAWVCRSAYRSRWQPGGRDDFLGFRLASGQSGQASEEREAGKQAGRRPAADGGERPGKKGRK